MANKRVEVTCGECGEKIIIARSSYDAIRREGRPFRCPACMKKHRAEMMKERNANRTPEEKAKQYESVSKKKKAFWASKSDEEKAQILSNANAGRDEWMKNVTDDEKQRISEIHSESNRRRWEAMTEEERKQVSLDAKMRWLEKSDEEKAAWGEQSKKSWASKSLQERYEWVNKIISRGGKTNNSLHKKFEEYFLHSHLRNDFYLKKEFQTSAETIHIWDYGIFNSSGKLVMVVDLDGSYYHADKCDYDGIHSKEEYDERRGLSVPNGIKNTIIQEEMFSRSFEEMMKSLIVDYDEWIKSIFKTFRMIPFPEPYYNDADLLKSYGALQRMGNEDVSLNSRIGDHIIQHFHKSIWQAHRADSPSPYEAWYNDDLLMKCIKNRVIYQNYLNPNKMLQGFNVSKIAPKVSVFSAGRARIIISKYLSEFNTIFDPFSGFSGRMLGAISLGKRYIGQDISPIHVAESNNILQFLHDHEIPFQAMVNQADSRNRTTGSYDCLFTCPPYSDKEQWLNVEPDTRSCDDWIDICLKNFKCKRYVFVVDYTKRYKDHIVEEIDSSSYLGKNNEYIIVINE